MRKSICLIVLILLFALIFILIVELDKNTVENDSIINSSTQEKISISESQDESLEQYTSKKNSVLNKSELNSSLNMTSKNTSTKKVDLRTQTTTKQTTTTTKKQFASSTTQKNSTTTKSELKSNFNPIQENVPSGSNGTFKSYTNYQLLSKSSPQWTKIQCNSNAYTDKNGLRKVGDYYCVAMGTYYAKNLGDLFEIHTEGGSYKVIICDWKANIHTDANNQYTIGNGCITEFYVDMETLNSEAKRMGNISYIGGWFSGKIIKINRLCNYFD